MISTNKIYTVNDVKVLANALVRQSQIISYKLKLSSNSKPFSPISLECLNLIAKDSLIYVRFISGYINDISVIPYYNPQSTYTFQKSQDKIHILYTDDDRYITVDSSHISSCSLSSFISKCQKNTIGY